MAVTKHVLFVCTGNTCRSPMAEGLLRQALGERPNWMVGSAGVAASTGAPANPETERVLKKRGASLTQFRSRQVTAKLLEQATHVFAMTAGHLDHLESRFPAYSDKYFLVRDFAGNRSKGEGTDVPDPIGMGPAAYDEVAELIERTIPSIIAYIDSTTGSDAPK